MTGQARPSWAETALGTVIELFDHKRVPLSGRERAERQGPYPYYGASGIIDHIDEYLFDGRYLLIAEDGENLNSRKTPIAFFGHGKFWVNNHSHVVRARQGVASDDFLMNFLRASDISGYITGTAQPKLSQANLCAIKMRLPPLHTQEKIAGVLSAYDDLIENNTRRIRILEEMAQTIYREWFVHFRFPGHKKVKLVPSPLGPIPLGWEVKRVTDAVSVDPTTTVPREGEKPFVPMRSLSNDSMLVRDIECRTGNSGSKFKNGDTLFARITPCLENGKTAFVQFLPTGEDVAFGSTEFIVLRSKTLSPEFVYLLARTPEFRNNAIKSMSGATGRQRVQPACIESFRFAHPDASRLRVFGPQVAPIFQEVQLIALKNENLRRTRDLLLPKLISGELDVSELDINVGDVAA